MNRFEIRDILNAHKEHYRVLPTLAYNELMGIIAAVDKESQFEDLPPVKVEKEPKRVVGKGTKKTAKKSKRS